MLFTRLKPLTAKRATTLTPLPCPTPPLPTRSYILMCLVITGMQPYNEIDINAPFSVAFDAVGLGWARTIVALGALAGILTSLLGSLMGQARIYVTLGRQHLLTPWLVRARGRGGVRRGGCVCTR